MGLRWVIIRKVKSKLDDMKTPTPAEQAIELAELRKRVVRLETDNRELIRLTKELAESVRELSIATRRGFERVI